MTEQEHIDPTSTAAQAQHFTAGEMFASDPAVKRAAERVMTLLVASMHNAQEAMNACSALGPAGRETARLTRDAFNAVRQAQANAHQLAWS